VNAAEVKLLLRLTGWSDEQLAVRMDTSARTVFNWRKKGCSRKHFSKGLRRLLEQAKRQDEIRKLQRSA